MQKRKWGKKYHTDQKLKCVKICCLSVANCQRATTWTTKQIYQTEPKRTNDCSLFAEDPRQSHNTSTEISIVIIFVAIFFFRLLCICSGRFAFFSLGFCAHEILRRCGQLHNLTPCYNKCMLLNVPSAFFFLQGRCIEPPKVKNILFGITLALDSNSFPRHRLQFECCISLHTSFRRTFFEFPSFTWKTDLSTWMNGVWSTNSAVFMRKKVFWLYCIDSHCIDDGNCVRWWYDRSVINITLHSHYR